MSRFAPTSTPRVGSSARRTAGRPAAHARTSASAGCRRTASRRRLSSGARRRRARQRPANARPLAPLADDPEAAQRAEAGQADVLANRPAQQQAVVLAGLRDHRDHARIGRRRGPTDSGPAGDATRSPSPATAPKIARASSAPAGADEPGQADDLARPEIDRCAVRLRPRESLDRRTTGASSRRRPGRGSPGRQVDRASPRSGRPRSRRRPGSSGPPAVTQDRDGVGQLEHLAEEVRDENDRPAARREPRRTISWKRSDLGRRECRSRLVEDDQLRIPCERPQDLDLLLPRDRQRSDDGVRRQLEAGRRYDSRSNRRASAPRRTNPDRRGSVPRKTFSATVRRGTRATSWATIAIPRSSASRGDAKLTGSPRA